MTRAQWEIYNMVTSAAVSEPMSKTAATRKLLEMVREWRGKSYGTSNKRHTAVKDYQATGYYEEPRFVRGSAKPVMQRFPRKDGPILWNFKIDHATVKTLSIRQVTPPTEGQHGKT